MIIPTMVFLVERELAVARRNSGVYDSLPQSSSIFILRGSFLVPLQYPYVNRSNFSAVFCSVMCERENSSRFYEINFNP